MNIEELLEQARPAERTIRLCLRGDLQAQWEQLDRDRARAQSEGRSDSLAGSPAVAIARQMQELSEQMEAATVTFRLRALPRRAYQALVAAHPPRRGPDGKVLPDDAEHDLNTATFWEPLIRATAVEPELTEAQWERLLGEVLSDRQFEQLAIAGLATCRGNVDVPFSSAASSLIQGSGGEPSAPDGSVSLSGASTDGSR